MANSDLRREFDAIIEADREHWAIEQACRDHRMELYTRYDFEITDATELLAQIMHEYCLEPEQMPGLIARSALALQQGEYGNAEA